MPLKTILSVNPKGHTVELRPQEILEVVITDKTAVKWNDDRDRWDGRNRPRLRYLRQETFITDGFDRGRNGNFRIRPVTQRQNMWQHHFWYRLDPKDFRKLENWPSQARIGTLNFIANDVVVGHLKVHLRFDEEDKEEYFNYLSQTAFRDQDPLGKEADFVGLVGRISKPDNGYLFNPTAETVVFESDEKTMLIEFSPPPGPGSANKRWKLSSVSKTRYEMDITEMAPRNINGKTVQRFLVEKYIDKIPHNEQQLRLGRFLFSVFEGNTHYVKSDRYIDFVMVRERKIGQEFVSDKNGSLWDLSDLDDQDAFLESVAREVEERKEPRRQRVVIEEMMVKGRLDTGTKTIKMNTVILPVKRGKLEVTNPQDSESFQIDDDSDIIFVFPLTNVSDQWCVSNKGDYVTLDYSVMNNKHHKFVFAPRPKANRKRDAEEILFRRGIDVRKVYVRRKSQRFFDAQFGE